MHIDDPNGGVVGNICDEILNPFKGIAELYLLLFFTISSLKNSLHDSTLLPLPINLG